MRIYSKVPEREEREKRREKREERRGEEKMKKLSEGNHIKIK